MDANLTRATNWLANHPWIACAILCASCVIAGQFDVVLP